MKIVDDHLIITHNWLIDYMKQCNLEVKKHGYNYHVISPLGIRIWITGDDTRKSGIEDRFDNSNTLEYSNKQGLCIGCWMSDVPVSQHNYCFKCDIIPRSIIIQLSWYNTRLVYSAKSDTMRLSEALDKLCRIELRIRMNHEFYISESDVMYSKNKINQLTAILPPAQLDVSQKIQYECHTKIISRYNAQNACWVYIDHLTLQYDFPADIRCHIKYILTQIMLCTRVTFAPWSLNDIKG
jgi:hypothetical protein